MLKFEKKIVKTIIVHYEHKLNFCEKHLKDGVRHEIGLLFNLLLSKLSIEASISFEKEEMRIITKSNLFQETKEDVTDLNPILTDDLNTNNLNTVKALQVISFLRTLEKKNYLILLFDPDIKDNHSNQVICSYTSIYDKQLIEFTKRLLHSRIIPATSLIEIARWNYRTETQQALHISRRANWITLIVGCASILFSVILTKCIPLSIEEHQHKELIEVIKGIDNFHTTESHVADDDNATTMNTIIIHES